MANSLRNKIKHFCYKGYLSESERDRLLNALDDADRINGKWIFHKPFDNGCRNCNECIECSQCHIWLNYDFYAKTPYCPNCGAKMAERSDSECQ